MKLIQGLTSQPKQQFTIPLTDGSRISVSMEYRQQQQGWFMDMVWQDFILNGLRVTASPNFLRQWSHILPFGVGIITVGNVEPLNLTDFSSNVASVYLLEGDEVQQVEETAFPGN